MKITGLMLMIWIIAVAVMWCFGCAAKCRSEYRLKSSNNKANPFYAEFDAKYEHVDKKHMAEGGCATVWKVKEKGDTSGTFYISKESRLPFAGM